MENLFMVIIILASALASFLFSSLWYGVMFRKLSNKLRENGDVMVELGGKAKRKMMAVKFLMEVITAISFYLAIFVPAIVTNSAVFSYMLVLIVILFFGMSFTIHMNKYMWGGKSMKLVFFDAAYTLLSYVVILSVMFMLMNLFSAALAGAPVN